MVALVAPRALAVLTASLAGCTLVLDPDNLPPRTDANVDATIVDAAIDADPSRLRIDSVEPATIREGTGAGGGRPAIVVLRGEALVGGAEVTVALAGADPGEAMLAGYVASVDGTSAALAVRIPVLPELAVGQTRMLELHVKQGDVVRSAALNVTGLGELVLNGPTAAAAASVQTYSRIEVRGAVHFTGSDPVQLHATADIAITRKLDVDASGATPGPHGCGGGASEGAGSCTPGGGHQGTNALAGGSGGGGGGFGAPGTAGVGATPGAPGDPTGRDTLVPIVSASGVAGNRGNGGGGGGKGLAGLGTPGGAGGGGGGVIWLQAGGDIVVSGSGAIAATGGSTTGGSGGGGGGSGGAILVRAGGTISAPGVWLSAAGGPGGDGQNNDGGPGGIGRVRVDAAEGNVAAMAAQPMAFRGPSWDKATPSLVTTIPNLTLLGQPGRAFPLRLNDAPVMSPATPGVDGRTTIRLPLAPGLNDVCAIAEPNMLQPESVSCVQLFYTGP